MRVRRGLLCLRSRSSAAGFRPVMQRDAVAPECLRSCYPFHPPGASRQRHVLRSSSLEDGVSPQITSPRVTAHERVRGPAILDLHLRHITCRP